MLAEFDSDSEGEGEKPIQEKPNTVSSKSPKPKNTTTAFTMDSDDGDDDGEGDGDEDEDIIMPRGRMAARLQGLTTDDNREPAPQPAESAFERVSKTLRAGKQDGEKTPRGSADEAVSSDDDLPAAGPRRRVQKTRDADAGSVRSRSQSRARSESPLFVSSPAKSQDVTEEQAEGAIPGDEDAAPKSNNRFLELVAKKRKEREAKERAEEEKKAAKAKEREAVNSNMFSDESADDEAPGRKKPQQPRPARKAGKKALEEMNRETQRMSRNMQLAHEAKTKKKITKESFFARFNFMQPQGQTAPEQPGDSSSNTAGSQHSSDVEAHKDKETPQTSPALPSADDKDDSTKGQHADEDMNFPSLEELLNEPAEETEKPAPEQTKEKPAKPVEKLSEVKKGKLPLRVAPARVRISREQVAQQQKDDSDDDLEIVTSPAKSRRIAAFENLPAQKNQEPASMFKLKALAQLTSPSRRSTMNSAELAASLLYQAKQQAGKERNERIEELRAKGIVIETAAERAAFEDEVENLVEKARQEGEEIAKEERAAKKRENGEDGDDEDDSDFQLSGSEDGDGDRADQGDGDDEDEGDRDEDDEEMEEADKEGDLVDSEAGEDENDDEDAGSEDESAEKPPVEETNVPTQRRKRPTRVLSDDEDEEDQAPKTPSKPINPFLNSVERPNIPVKPSEATMSLTQAFAGTLATSHDLSQGGDTMPQSLPEPVPMSPDREPDSQSIVKDSQEQRAGSADLFPGYWQPDDRVSESPAARSVSQFPEPTQDAGFVLSPFDPNKRFLSTPTSTIETVLVDQNRSPVAARKPGNLRRGKAPQVSAVEEEDEPEGDFEIDASAFDVMKTASKKQKNSAELFDRKKSKAKDVVEEDAEESDDEYAGLGGGSDDDADDEENALDREMINDQSGERVDAKQLAALNA